MVIKRKGTTKDDPRSGGSTLCRDIPGINVSSDRTRINKKKGEKGLEAFNRWSKDEADGWCESGLCANGKCRGQRSELDVKLLNETANYIEVQFTMKVTCKCE